MILANFIPAFWAQQKRNFANHNYNNLQLVGPNNADYNSESGHYGLQQQQPDEWPPRQLIAAHSNQLYYPTGERLPINVDWRPVKTEPSRVGVGSSSGEASGSQLLTFLANNKQTLASLIQLLPLIAQTISLLPRLFSLPFTDQQLLEASHQSATRNKSASLVEPASQRPLQVHSSSSNLLVDLLPQLARHYLANNMHAAGEQSAAKVWLAPMQESSSSQQLNSLGSNAMQLIRALIGSLGRLERRPKAELRVDKVKFI